MGRFAFFRRFRRSTSTKPYPIGRLGIQDTGSGGSGATSDLYRDRFQQCRITDEGYDTYLPTVDGLNGSYNQLDGTINQIKPGDSHFKALLKVFWAETGDYLLSYPTGMHCTLFNGHSKTLSAETVNGSVTTCILNVPTSAEAPGLSTSELRFTGVPTGRTATTLGCLPTLIKVGDVDTTRIASVPYENSLRILNSKCLRVMDWRNVNANLKNYDFARINNAYTPGLAFFVEICNRLDMDLWLNMPFYQTDAAAYAEFQYVLQNLKPTLHLFVEWVNEVWNSGQKFNAHWLEATLQGMHMGFASSATSAGATAIGAATYPITGNVNGNSGLPLRNFSTNDTVEGNISGIGVQRWRALQPVTANDAAATLTSAANAYWAVEINSSASSNARARYYSYRAVAVGGIALQAAADLGIDPDRVRLVLAWQNGSSILTGSASFVAQFDNNFARGKFRHHAVAPYYAPTMGNFQTNDVGTWTYANKQLYISDLTACLNAFFDPSAAPQLAVSVAAGFVAQAADLATLVANSGLPVKYCQMAAYEFGPSNNIVGASGATHIWPDANAALALANAIQQDPRTAAIWRDYIATIRSVGGPVNWYARYGTVPWIIQNDELDHSSVSFTALAAAGALVS